MPNPFFFAGKITNPEQFIGREKELKRIFGYLDTTQTSQIQHVSVVGERRIGKSSLLYHISQCHAEYLNSNDHSYRFVYLDLDDPRCHTQCGLLRHILERLDLPVPAQPSLEKFYELLEHKHEQDKLWPVLLLDEFEHLPQRAAEFPDGFYETLRSLGNNNLAGIVTASQHPLKDLAQQGKLTSPFFNIFHQLDLTEFTELEANALLNRGRASERPFTDDDCQQILKIAGKRPGCLQVVASLAYDAKVDGKIDWKAIKSESLKEPPFLNGQKENSSWFIRAGRWLFWDAPQMLGHAVLVFIKRTEGTNEITDRFWGYVVIAIPILIYFGVISLPLVTKIIRRVAELFQ